MCHLAVYPPGVMPKLEHLANAARLNEHGYGWSIGLAESYRSLPPCLCIPMFLKARRGAMDEPAMFWARYATAGATSLANVQPLVLDDGSILAHNGGLFDVDGPESDTRVFARDILPRWDMDSYADRKELAELIYPNKIALFRPDKAPVVLNDRLGIWQDGAWHSNEDFTGLDHKRPGVCASCGVPVDSDQPAQQCAKCQVRYAMRKAVLYDAR